MPKPKIDEDTCIGCGACVAICPEVYELGDDGKSHVKNPDGCNTCDCQASADSCPVAAIIIE